MARKAVGTPTLFFNMPVDQQGGQIIAGLNKGRLSLFDDLGMIGRWVFTSSFDGRQKVNDWELVGGLLPPTSAMPGQLWYEVGTNLIKQPGQPVDEGFIIYYKGEIEFKTAKGSSRSQLMIHKDSNYKTAPGSYGCLVGLEEEYVDMRDTFIQACGHLKRVRMGGVYSF